MKEPEGKETVVLTPASPRAEPAVPQTEPVPRRAGYMKLREATEDAGAKRLCAILLEVLGGVRTPTDAAGVLGVSVPRYYALEARGLRGLLRACQRRQRGRQRTAESELAQLRQELERVLKERDRLGALLRTSQRALGIGAPGKPSALVPPKAGGRRRRRPQVRALRAASALGSAGAPGAPAQKPAHKALEPAPGSRENAPAVKG